MRAIVLLPRFIESRGAANCWFASKDEAIESTLQFMELHKLHRPGWEGETEVRPIFGPEDFPPTH
jgi:hypothetical protein